MSKRKRCLLIVLTLVFVLVAGVLAMMVSLSSEPSNLGVVDGRLTPCPASPNCVSSQATDADHRMEPIRFAGTSDEALQRVKKLVEQMPRTKIVTLEDDYLHAEFRSAVFRFVDDVEFVVDPEARRVHFRSASRVGYSDMGANRRRMEKIRAAFADHQPIVPGSPLNGPTMSRVIQPP